MGKIKVTCDCGKSFAVPEEHAGKRGKCPGCGEIVDIPLEAEPSEPEPTTCRECGADVEPGEKFCSDCGAPTSPSVDVRRRRRRPNIAREWAKYSHKKNIGSARKAMIAVAILTILGALFIYGYWASLPSMYRVPEVNRTFTILLVIQFVIAAAFFGCFFWAKGSPVPATLTALIIYLTMQLVQLAFDHKNFLNVFPMLIRIVIIGALVYGVKSALVYKRMEDQDQKNRAREAGPRRAPIPPRRY